MRRLSLAFILIGSLLALPAQAANFSAKDAAAATIIFTNPGNCTTGCTPIFAWSDSTGANLVAVLTAGADGASNTANGGIVYNRNMVYNGTTWDRWQGAVSLASGKVASGAFASGSIASGAMVDLGSQADAACGTANGSCSLIALQKYNNQQAATIVTNTGAAIPAGTAYIGQASPDPSKGGGTPSSVAINVSTATTTQLVAISGSTSIYVTSFDVIAGGTGNITFEYGTGSNCGTGTTALTGAYNLTAQAGIAKGNGAGTILKVPSGNALCVLTSAAVQMSGSVSFQQF